MLGMLGIVVVFAMVFGGYIAAGGKMGIILKALPYEMTMIMGAATGAFLIANDKGGVKHTIKDVAKVFKGPHWKQQDYRDLLCLLFELLRLARQTAVALEEHIENPRRFRDLRPLPAHPVGPGRGRTDLRHAALGGDELRRSPPGRGGAGQAPRGTPAPRAAFLACVADGGRTPCRRWASSPPFWA